MEKIIGIFTQQTNGVEFNWIIKRGYKYFFQFTLYKFFFIILQMSCQCHVKFKFFHYIRISPLYKIFFLPFCKTNFPSFFKLILRRIFSIFVKVLDTICRKKYFNSFCTQYEYWRESLF